MKLAVSAFRVLLALTVLTGLFYPCAMTLLAQAVFKHKADGSMIVNNGNVIGSQLIAQKFTSARYFWPRPSSVDYNPMPSGASNLGPTSTKLRDDVIARRKALVASSEANALADNQLIPNDLLFTSGSGLDPHISPFAAHYQVDRIATARNVSSERRAQIHELIMQATEPRQLGFLGEPRVNVLLLNLRLDEALR